MFKAETRYTEQKCYSDGCGKKNMRGKCTNRVGLMWSTRPFILTVQSLFNIKISNRVFLPLGACCSP